MSEEAFVCSAATKEDLDSTDLTPPAKPYFQGTIPAIVKSIREVREKRENEHGEKVETGRISFAISCSPQEELKEYLEAPGEVSRTFAPGERRIETFIDWKCATAASDRKKEMEADARTDFGIATGIIKTKREAVPVGLLAGAIDKPVVLKLSVTKGEKGWFQNVRFKAPASSNGAAKKVASNVPY